MGTSIVLKLTYPRNSLAKLRTHYIDILYVHWWDWNTSVEEVMDGLHNLVVAGKVLYLVSALCSGVYTSHANKYVNNFIGRF